MAYYNSISGYSSTRRLTGLSSGLDTDSLIKASMTASQSKLDRMYQNKTKLEWKRDAYTDVRTKVSTFSSKYLSTLSPDNIFSKSAYKQYKVSISDKYDSYFSVKGTATAQPGSHRITSTKLATAATIQGAKYRNRAAGITGGTATNSKVAKTVGSETLYRKVDTGSEPGITESTEGVVKGTDGNLYKQITSDDTTVKLSDVYKLDSAKNSSKVFENGVAGFKVNGQSVSGTTLGELVSGVNGNGKTGAKMSIENGKIAFEGTQFGTNSGITFENVGSTDIFGKKGAFGIDSTLKAEPMNIRGMTLKDLVAARNANTQYDAKGNVIDPVKTDTDGSFTIKIGSGGDKMKEFTFNEDMTVQAVLNEVNQANAETGVTMSFENGQFSVRSTDLTSSTRVVTENVKGSFFGGDESLTGVAVDDTTGYQSVDRSADTIASAAAKMGVILNGNGPIKFKINGEEFSFSQNTKLEKMMAEINSNTKVNAKMTYSQISDSFVITSSETGHANTVKFESDDQNAFTLFGISNDLNGVTTRGTDAEITIDNETIKRSSNKFVLDGMEITIKDNWVADLNDASQTEKPTAAGLGTAMFSVEQDVDSVVDKMKSFVKAYNELVDELYKLTTEEKDYDYDALTEDQRDNMEKEDIEKWETEAKKGILRNDNTIRTFLSNMRKAVFEKIGGTRFDDITSETKDKGLSAADIGFGTSVYSQGEYSGKLTFDEDKFREALQRDPDTVADIMANVSDASDKDTEYKESGFATKLFDQMSDFVNTMRGTNIKNVNTQIEEANKQMDNQLQKMYEEQERLYKQYAALETLMTQYQNQSTWLTNQLAGLTTSTN